MSQIVEVPDISEVPRPSSPDEAPVSHLSRQERRAAERSKGKTAAPARMIDPATIRSAAGAMAGGMDSSLAALPGIIGSLGQAVESISASSASGASDREVMERALGDIIAGMTGISGQTRIQVGAMKKAMEGKIDASVLRQIETATGGKNVMSVRDFKKALIGVLAGPERATA